MRYLLPDAQSWAALYSAVKAGEISKNALLTDDCVRAKFTKWEFQESGERKFNAGAYLRALEALRRYTFRPYVNLAISSRNIRAVPAQLVPVGWDKSPTVNEADSGKWPTIADKKRDPIDIQEAWMVLLLMGLSSAGEVARLRECDCGLWFYARRPEKRHCSEPCRKKAYKPSLEQQEHRREYMRKYMKDERDQNSKTKTKGRDHAKS